MNAATALHNATTRLGLATRAFSPATLAFIHAHRTPAFPHSEALDAHTGLLSARLIDAALHAPWQQCVHELAAANLHPKLLRRMLSETSIAYMRTLLHTPLAPVPLETQYELCGDQLQMMLHLQLLKKAAAASTSSVLSTS